MIYPYRLNRRIITFSLLAAVLGAITPLGMVSAQEPGDSQVVWRMELPEGEEQDLKRHTFTRESLTFGMLTAVAEIHGPGPILFEAAVVGPSCSSKPLHFAVNNSVYEDYRWNDLQLHQNTYSRLFTIDSPDSGHEVALEMFFADGSELSVVDEESHAVPNAPDGWACVLMFRITRNLDGCTMWASTRGDVVQEAYGSVAYFNTFENGVPITTGTIADPGMHQQLDDFGEFMGEMIQMAQQSGYEVPGLEEADGYGPNSASSSGSMQQMRDEMFAEGGDKFGLTLTSVNADTAAQESGGESTMELAQGLATLAGAFTLEASAPGGVEFLESPEQSIDLETGEGSIMTIPLSSLRVVPGGLDGEFNRVPFVFEEGQGSAILTIEAVDKDFIMGQVGGELVSDKKYDGERLRISVAATFAARRGFKSCIR